MAKQKRLIPRATSEQAAEFIEFIANCCSIRIAADTIGISYQTAYNAINGKSEITLKTYQHFKNAMAKLESETAK